MRDNRFDTRHSERTTSVSSAKIADSENKRIAHDSIKLAEMVFSELEEKRFFQTEGGLIALGWNSVRKGDDLVVLPGSDKLVLVREERNDHNPDAEGSRHVFASDCYVSRGSSMCPTAPLPDAVDFPAAMGHEWGSLWARRQCFVDLDREWMGELADNCSVSSETDNVSLTAGEKYTQSSDAYRRRILRWAPEPEELKPQI